MKSDFFSFSHSFEMMSGRILIVKVSDIDRPRDINDTQSYHSTQELKAFDTGLLVDNQSFSYSCHKAMKHATLNVACTIGFIVFLYSADVVIKKKSLLQNSSVCKCLFLLSVPDLHAPTLLQLT